MQKTCENLFLNSKKLRFIQNFASQTLHDFKRNFLGGIKAGFYNFISFKNAYISFQIKAANKIRAFFYFRNRILKHFTVDFYKKNK